jgi:hypothetical protein
MRAAAHLTARPAFLASRVTLTLAPTLPQIILSTCTSAIEDPYPLPPSPPRPSVFSARLCVIFSGPSSLSSSAFTQRPTSITFRFRTCTPQSATPLQSALTRPLWIFLPPLPSTGATASHSFSFPTFQRFNSSFLYNRNTLFKRPTSMPRECYNHPFTERRS